MLVGRTLTKQPNVRGHKLRDVSISNAQIFAMSRSQVQKKTLNPTWNETYVFSVADVGNNPPLDISVWDYDKFTSDDAMGMQIVLGSLEHSKTHPVFLGTLNSLTHHPPLSLRLSLSLSLSLSPPTPPC